MAVIACLCLAGFNCCTDGSLSPPGEAGSSIEIISPERTTLDSYFPIIIRALDREGGTDTNVNMETPVTAGNTVESITLKKGMGSALIISQDAPEGALSLETTSGSRVVSLVDSFPVEEYSGQLKPGLHTWDRSKDRYVAGELVVPTGTTLVIEEGTRILLGSGADVVVHGRIQAKGTLERPIVYMSSQWRHPWGGIEVVEGRAEFTHSFFVNGGANRKKVFGHSNSQAVVMARRADVRLTACYFLDNPGKALGGWESHLTIDRCLISRCDTGGEFESSVALISNTHVIDIPNGDGVFVDDDNDGFYFNSVYPQAETPSLVRDSFVITGKDDAIDHNGALLEIRNCWLEGFAHEGVAASNDNWVQIFNTVIRGCEQGIEAGYGRPRVLVDHCVVVENGVGLRFGDSYDWGSEGHMIVSNSIIFNNKDNILNHDLKTGKAVQGAIVVDHSLVADSELDSSATVWGAVPLFDENYRLLPSSPGIGRAVDGSDIGLVDLD